MQIQRETHLQKEIQTERRTDWQLDIQTSRRHSIQKNSFNCLSCEGRSISKSIENILSQIITILLHHQSCSKQRGLNQ